MKKKPSKPRAANDKFFISDTYFRKAIETVDDYAIFLMDKDGIIQTWTKGAERIKGYKAKEIIGQHYRVLFPEDAAKEKLPEDHLKEAETTGIYTEKAWRKRKNGDLFWAHVHLTSIRDSNNELIGFAKITQDVTEEKLAEQVLEETELRFRNLADTAPMYIAVADETGKAVYFNKPWLEYTGKTLDEMKGMGWLSTLHPEDAPKFEEDFKKAFNDQTSINEQYRFRRKDGIYRWMLAVGAPRFTPDGKFIGYFGTYTDFHELKKAQLALQASEERFRVVSDNATTGLFIMDDTHHCIFMNPAAEGITGFTFDKVKEINKPLHDIIHHKKPDGSNYPMEECPIDRALPEKNQTKGEDVFVKPDGSFYPVAFTASPIVHDGKPIGTVIEVRDTTEEKQIDEKRRQLEKQKDEFIGIASHELKTPVTSIKAYGQVLEKMFRKKGDVRTAEYIAKLDTQVDRLSMLIGDLLDVTKIQSGKLKFNEGYFDFNELVSEIVDDIQLTATRHKLVKNFGTTKSIYGDRDRIGQVISNLITNAIKYSPKADEVIICTDSSKEEVTLCVQDFGVGIAKDKKDKVFEQFYRVSGDEEITFPGLGLGLYISSEIIKRQNGRIWVESTLGKGSKFCFSLPIPKKKRK
jgi:PAS domain S-box-containing protein